MSAPLPRVSVIVPVRNEERYVGQCLSRLLCQEYPAELLEILVVDSGSTDRTAEIIKELAGGGPPARPALRFMAGGAGGRPAALNTGIRTARGDIIVRVDARSMVPVDYVRKCVDTLGATGADNVGGVQQPIADSLMQEAIGIAMSHPFGVGNAQFRMGKKSGYVDTVYLGSFRREVFSRVGLFDEAVPILSEDSDMNQRIHAAGGRVYLNTEIRIPYYPRETLPDFASLYFRYGVARAGNVWKHGTLTAWRQAVPPFLVFVLAALAFYLFAPRHPGARLALSVVLSAYALADLGVSAQAAIRRQQWQLWPRLLLVFPCMHFAWGFGFFYGLIAGFGRMLRGRTVRPPPGPVGADLEAPVTEEGARAAPPAAEPAARASARRRRSADSARSRVDRT